MEQINVSIQRPVLSEPKFEELFSKPDVKTNSLIDSVRKVCSRCTCSSKCAKSFMMETFPFVRIMRKYNLKNDLISDIISGLTVGVMNLPQGMAYGLLASLTPVHGLYTSFFPVLVYFFFGSSKHVAMGTWAVTSLMIASALVEHVENSSTIVTANGTNGSSIEIQSDKEAVMMLKVSLATALTFCVGIFQTYRDFFERISTINWATVITSLICIIVLHIISNYVNPSEKFKKISKVPVPIELIVVIFGTVASYFIQLEKEFGVHVVGDIPRGLPAPSVSQLVHIPDVIEDAVIIAIVVYAVSISMAKILAEKHNYSIDPNQELIANAFCNIISSFFSSFVCAASLSRSLVQERVGGKTQVAALVSCLLVLVVLLALGPLFYALPQCVLSAIIIVALKGMFMQALQLKSLWSISKIDFTIWLVTFLGTVVLNVDLGLGVGFVSVIMSIIFRNQIQTSTILGNIPGTELYRDVRLQKQAKEIPGVKIFHFPQSLYFVNAETFRSSIYEDTKSPKSIKSAKLKEKHAYDNTQMAELIVDPPVKVNGKANGMQTSVYVEPSSYTSFRVIIIDCSAWSFIDPKGIKTLISIIREYQDAEVEIWLASCSSNVQDMFEKMSFYKTLGRDKVFATIHDAVIHWKCRNARRESKVESVTKL
ncbi:hypothetical protein ACJMK2_019798 [Sinanodonta woodiana]|uniref:STAS domain-containing protein n=1 Tax=Sinanodonta woodiana TaxID=1069815 RepID=A0ABD3TZ95_SINWO